MYCLFLLVLACRGDEINNTGNPPIVNIASDPPSLDDWIEVARFSTKSISNKPTIEVHLDMTVLRTGVVGTLLDLFLVSSVFDVAITTPDRLHVITSNPYEGSSAMIEVTIEEYSSIVVLFRNRNTFCSVVPMVLGEIFSSADVFDLRAKYSKCLFPIYMQGICGSCYADVVAGAGTEVACIAGKSGLTQLSPQPLVSCSNLGGCSGGSPYLAALWTANHGLVEQDQCPYESTQCDPAIDVEKNGCFKCSLVENELKMAKKRYYFSPVVIQSSSEYAMRRRIESGGSVMVIFDAHANFQEFFQKHPFGIYKSTNSSPSLGNHSIRLVGFGIEGDVKYWIGLNSWGSSWGDRGSFKILRGENLCNIEQYPVGLNYIGSDSPVVAGASSEPSNSLHVGDWTVQDPLDPFWAMKIAEWRVESSGFDRILVNDTVVFIATRITNGYRVKIKCKGGAEIKVYVDPSGRVEFRIVSENVMIPEHRHVG